MDPKKKNNPLNSRELRLLVLVGFLSVSVAAAWLIFSPDGIPTYINMKKQLLELKTENQRLQEENRLLRTKIDTITTDPAYLEEVARQDFHLLKKDEIVFEFR